jgi:hypothetical protein
MPFRPSPHISFTVSRRVALAGAAVLAAGAIAAGRSVAQTPAVPAGIDFTDRITPLLAAAPEMELDDSQPLAYYYADLAGQLASLGVERLDPAHQMTKLSDGFFAASVAIPLASRAFQSGVDPEWFQTFGFNPFAIGQALEIAMPPKTISIFRDGFERATVEAALEASGYTLVLQETGGDYWTLGDDADLDSMVGRLSFGTMNSAYVTDDVLVFTQREADIQAVTQALAGYAPSMAEQGLWTGMVGEFASDTVGLVPLAPGVLGSAFEPSATPAPAVAVDVQYLAFGVRAGARSAPIALVGEGTPEATPTSHEAAIPARVQARIRYGSEETARREAEEIPQRWETLDSLRTGEPYTALMTVEDARVSGSNPQVAAIDFVTVESPQVWIQLIHTRDLLPFTPRVG